jgi:hypothetical protein
MAQDLYQNSNWMTCHWQEIVEDFLRRPLDQIQEGLASTGFLIFLSPDALPQKKSPGQWRGLSGEALTLDWILGGALSRRLLDLPSDSPSADDFYWFQCPLELRSLEQSLPTTSPSPGLHPSLNLFLSVLAPSSLSEKQAQEVSRRVLQAGFQRVICIRPPVSGLRVAAPAGRISEVLTASGSLRENHQTNLTPEKQPPQKKLKLSGGEFWVAN